MVIDNLVSVRVRRSLHYHNLSHKNVVDKYLLSKVKILWHQTMVAICATYLHYVATISKKQCNF